MSYYFALFKGTLQLFCHAYKCIYKSLVWGKFFNCQSLFVVYFSRGRTTKLQNSLPSYYADLPSSSPRYPVNSLSFQRPNQSGSRAKKTSDENFVYDLPIELDSCSEVTGNVECFHLPMSSSVRILT